MRHLLEDSAQRSIAYLERLGARGVAPSAEAVAALSALEEPLAEKPIDPETVLRLLDETCSPASMAMAGPRFFGFVTGGSLPVTVAANWLASAWDQNAAFHSVTPAAAALERVALRWLIDILGLPPGCEAGFVTGATLANFGALAAARHAVLKRAGWNVEAEGLFGAPPVNVVVGEEAHSSLFKALGLLGLGRKRVVRVPVDGQGRMRADALPRISGPTIVCTQAGNVNTGAIDPVGEICRNAHASGAWVHVDGAFGLWATTSPELRPQTAGIAAADSWATDGHKWLNVPYDSGIVIVADSAAHRGAMSSKAAYLIEASGPERDPLEYVPEFSRRARGFAVYAALRSLGRRGVTDMIERCSRLARRMGDRLKSGPGVRILNDIALNQVLVRFEAPGLDADALTRAVITRVQEDGTCWLSGSKWHEMQVMRVSVSNWSTTDADIDRSADAILSALRVELSAAGR
jgi:glutamate/tyrosine decarboxylase-like PLP-dependent enzyme